MNHEPNTLQDQTYFEAPEATKGQQFTNCTFQSANLSGKNFSGSTFTNCTFDHAYAKGADFTNASFDHCTLSHSSFKEASFKEAGIEKTQEKALEKPKRHYLAKRKQSQEKGRER